MGDFRIVLGRPFCNLWGAKDAQRGWGNSARRNARGPSLANRKHKLCPDSPPTFGFFPPSAEWWVLVFNNRRSASHYFHLTTSSSLLPPHAWIRRQFYTFRTSYLARTSPNRGDYESVPSVDTSTVLHFQHFILKIIIIKNTNSTTVLHFQHFMTVPYPMECVEFVDSSTLSALQQFNTCSSKS